MAGIFTTFQLHLRSSRNEAEPFELFFADALHASGSLDVNDDFVYCIFFVMEVNRLQHWVIVVIFL